MKKLFHPILKLFYPIFEWLWHYYYPIAARKSLEDWNRMVELEFALELIKTNPESAHEIATLYLKRLEQLPEIKGNRKWGLERTDETDTVCGTKV